jgi:hypothetical protein
VIAIIEATIAGGSRVRLHEDLDRRRGALLLTGCGPEAPEARYSGSTLAAKDVSKLRVFRGGEPDRPFAELGTVEVSCPSKLSSGPYGGGDIVGGCTYDEAVGMATAKAAESGADAIYALHTAAAGNGSLVSMTAIAVRFTAPKPPAAPVAPKPPTATVEERLLKLKQLNEQKLITDDEYAKRKAEILKEKI